MCLQEYLKKPEMIHFGKLNKKIKYMIGRSVEINVEEERDCIEYDFHLSLAKLEQISLKHKQYNYVRA